MSVRVTEARMLWVLAAIAMALVVSACNRSAAPPAAPLLELSGDPSVAIRSVKITGALSHADALTGLKEALPYIQQAAKQSEAGKIPGGSFEASFQTEPDGMIRMMLEGENRLTGDNAAEVVEGLVGSAMGNKWRFPASGGPSLIEVEFVVGQL